MPVRVEVGQNMSRVPGATAASAATRAAAPAAAPSATSSNPAPDKASALASKFGVSVTSIIQMQRLAALLAYQKTLHPEWASMNRNDFATALMRVPQFSRPFSNVLLDIPLMCLHERELCLILRKAPRDPCDFLDAGLLVKMMQHIIVSTVFCGHQRSMIADVGGAIDS